MSATRSKINSEHDLQSFEEAKHVMAGVQQHVDYARCLVLLRYKGMLIDMEPFSEARTYAEAHERLIERYIRAYGIDVEAVKRGARINSEYEEQIKKYFGRMQ